jgi:hypothetical protein
MNSLNDKAGFLMSGSNPSLLVMSEFGMDMSDIDDKNQRFISCILAYLVGVDLDWALWAAQGAYYIREKENNVSEHYSIWNIDFSALRYLKFHQRFQLVQKKLLGVTFLLLKKVELSVKFSKRKNEISL